MSTRHAWIPLVGIALGITMGFLISATITYTMPKVYESETIIQIRPETMAPGTMRSFDSSSNERSLATQREILLSREVLERVTHSLQLSDRWNLDRDNCIQVLQAALRTESVIGTDLVKIMCRHTNPVDARDIANGVADAYKDYRQQAEQVIIDRHLQELNKAVREQEEKVDAARKALDVLIRNPSNPDAKPVDIVDAQSDVDTESELLTTLKLKQVAETISRKIPGESVQIHSKATIGQAPVSPNVSYNLMVGTFSGFVAGAVIGVLLMLILNQHPTRP